ncbi:MAG: inosine monophosphate cyclohydrolase [Clostridiales bacterium]|nr:inosine monophosphate cyclohydrolase [Clostridiales bacterium]
MTIREYLHGNTYPGRGIMLGLHEDGKTAVAAYFIMGRSVNSRNRVFVLEGEDMRTKAYDESKMADPSLVIYYPVRTRDGYTIITNGDQTDTIRDFMADGGTFEQALRTREFEPDPPIFTPRISGIMRFSGLYGYKLSILKSDGEGKSCQRYFFEYDSPIAGQAHIIHTYLHDGNPVPSFEGEPAKIEIGGAIEEVAKELWESLDGNNKVSLFVRFTDIDTGKSETKIINRLEE